MRVFSILMYIVSLYGRWNNPPTIAKVHFLKRIHLLLTAVDSRYDIQSCTYFFRGHDEETHIGYF